MSDLYSIPQTAPALGGDDTHRDVSPVSLRSWLATCRSDIRHHKVGAMYSDLMGVLSLILKTAVVLALLGMVVLVLASIIGRRFFAYSPASWEEVATYLFIWVVMLGTALTIRDRSILSIRMLTDRFPNQAHGLDLFAQLITGGFFAAGVVAGWQLIPQANLISTPDFSLSEAWGFAAIFVGSAAALAFVVEIVIPMIDRSLQTLGAIVAFLVCLGIYYFFHESSFAGVGIGVVLVALGVFVFAALANVPVACALGLGAYVAANASHSTPLEAIANNFASGLNSLVLLAIPFFLLAGLIMSHSSLSGRLLNAAKAAIGKRRSGVATADVVASVLFADMSGSAIADTAALGTVVIPELVEVGYTKERAVGLQAAAGALGIMFPPSVTMIIYASVANISVTQAFLSVIIPGVILASAFAVISWFYARRNNVDIGVAMPLKERALQLGAGIPTFIIPALILGGIFSGLASPAEAGSLAVLAALALSLLFYRDLKVKHLPKISVEAAMTVARVGLVISTATAFAFMLVSFNGPQELLNDLLPLSHQPIVILLILAVVLLLLHTMMDATATMLVVTPLLAPVLASLNISLLRFGVIIDVTSAAGLILPPLGFNLYIVSQIGGVTMERAAKAALPFVGLSIATAVLIIFVPTLSTWLPSLLNT